MSVTELHPALVHDSAPQPHQMTRRWCPTRAGVVNVWRYYGETFDLHQGRLLLRGPNGTGKSKALELLLPYLLDANLRPNRLSTFGGSERTMYWNLMGDGYSQTRRVGYVWMEFGRTGDEGEEWFTCGARLQASKNSRQVQATYFTTRQRVDMPGGLSLTSDDGRPLAKKDLNEALEGPGQTFDSAADYRRAVRQQLFPEFSGEQYEALITALLQLRTPKLSEHLDPDTLSDLLSQALPPLDHADIAEIAEGFEKLDRRREDLARLGREVAAAESLATRARTYARRVLRAGAQSVISATSAMTRATRRTKDCQQQYERAAGELARLETQQAELDEEHHELGQRIDGLEDSDSYRAGKDLDELRQAAEQAERQAQLAHAKALSRGDEATTDEQSAEQLRHTARTAEELAGQARDEAEQAARRAGMTASFAELGDQTSGGDVAANRRLLRAAAESRREQIEQLRAALGDHETAVQKRSAAESRLERRRGEVADAEQRLRDRQQRHEQAVTGLRDDLRHWARACVELPLGQHAETLVAAAEDEKEVSRIVGAAATWVGENITRSETARQAERVRHVEERDSRAQERSDLENRTAQAPVAPRTRTADRTTMPGAPLWELVDWRPGVDDETQAAIEAALEASGMLDGWMLPSGEMDIAGHDTFVAADLASPAGGSSLSDVLTAEPGDPVSGGQVEQLLTGIAYAGSVAGHPAAIGGDGTWKLGVTYGSWAKPAAEHIGATARERARQRRIEELTRTIEQLDRDIAAVDEQLGQLAARRECLEDEQAHRPSHQPLQGLTADVDRAEADLAARRDTERSADTERREAEEHVTAALRQLTLLASQQELPSTREGLDAITSAVRAYRNSGDTWLDRLQQARAAAENADQQAERAQQSRNRANEAQEHADELGQIAADKRTKYVTVEESVGVEYREIVARLAELRRRVQEISDESSRLRASENELRERLGQLGSDLKHAQEDGRRASQERDQAAERFRHLAASEFTEDARLAAQLPDMPTTTACLDAARAIAEELGSTPHESHHIKNAERNVQESMYATQQALAGRADLRADEDGDVVMLVATVDGAHVGAAGLHKQLDEELAEARNQLTDDEQQLFDRTLTGDTRRQVASRIRQAEDLKDSINAALQRVRTVSKLQVKLDWQIDPELPAGTKEARNLLLRDPAGLSDADRQALHDFFRTRIEEVRAADTAADWEQQLLQVLDYRRWHQFLVLMNKADDQGWVAVSKRRHGALSGGEKAIALHLPLFAAAAAHYRVSPTAPRLILLDEVFVGVDVANRGQLLDLLTAFDLDMVMTSDHEWCTYQELDGVAIHQLITDDEDDAVTTVRFLWDGARLHEAEPDAGPGGNGAGEPYETTLFDD